MSGTVKWLDIHCCITYFLPYRCIQHTISYTEHTCGQGAKTIDIDFHT